MTALWDSTIPQCGTVTCHCTPKTDWRATLGVAGSSYAGGCRSREQMRGGVSQYPVTGLSNRESWIWVGHGRNGSL